MKLNKALIIMGSSLEGGGSTRITEGSLFSGPFFMPVSD